MADFLNNILSVAGRGLEGGIDHLAENSTGGAILQALVNTDKYKLKQTLMGEVQKKISDDEAERQQKQKRYKQEDIDTQQKNKAYSEWNAAAPVRVSSNETELIQNRARQYLAQQAIERSSEDILNSEKAEVGKIVENRNMANETYRNLTDASKTELKASDPWKQNSDWMLINRLWIKSQKDPKYKEVLDKSLSQQNLEIQDRDGQSVLIDNNRKVEIPLTWENHDEVSKRVNESFANELNARLEAQGPRDNVYKNAFVKMAKMAAPVNGGSMAKSKAEFQTHLLAYPENERSEFVLAENFADAKSDNVLTKQEMSVVVPQMKAVCDRIGWRVHVDEENPLNSKVEVEGGALLPIETAINEIAKRNTIRSDWEAGIAVKKQAMEARAREQQWKDLKLQSEALSAKKKVEGDTLPPEESGFGNAKEQTKYAGLYGDGVYKMSPADQAKLKQAESVVKEIATQAGIFDKDGKPNLSDPKAIRNVRANFDNVMERYGLGKYKIANPFDNILAKTEKVIDQSKESAVRKVYSDYYLPAAEERLNSVWKKYENVFSRNGIEKEMFKGADGIEGKIPQGDDWETLRDGMKEYNEAVRKYNTSKRRSEFIYKHK